MTCDLPRTDAKHTNEGIDTAGGAVVGNGVVTVLSVSCWKPSSNSPKSASSSPSSNSSKSSPKLSSSSSSSSLSSSLPLPCNELGDLIPGDAKGLSSTRDKSQSNCGAAQEDLVAVPVDSPVVSSWPGIVFASAEPSGFRTKSGVASALCAFSWKWWVLEPGSSTVSSTTVLGTLCLLGVVSPSSALTSCLWLGMTAISSGFASPVRLAYASVPGTSPYDGSSSIFSTRVLGMGELGLGLAAATD
jgi:hypothetical protein